MPTQTFPCPFCGKKMGVGIELLGKKVRCPHCNQILVAPAPASAAVSPPVAVPVVVAPPPPPPPEPEPSPPADLPVFNLPSQEARESIFDEHQDEGDDVFSSTDGNKLQMPDVPPPLMPRPSPAPKTSEAQNEPTVEMNSPFAGFAGPVLSPKSPSAAAQPVPVVVPVPAPKAYIPTVAPIGATPPSSSGANPWAGMDQLAAAPAPVAVPVPTLVPVPMPVAEPPFSQAVDEPKLRAKDRDGDRTGKRSRVAAPAGNPLFKVGFFVLAPYALIVTAIAAYGLFFKSSTPAGHPLSTIPDNFGEFNPAERKKTGKLTIPVDGELPPELKVALGSKLEIGQLEIEPFRVELRPLKIVTEGKSTIEKKIVQTSTSPAVVLRLKIKNLSDDLLIHPLDPAFNRRITGTERVGTGLVAGKQTLWGGAIPWPFAARASRVYEAAQEADATPLKPGEAREFVVFTNTEPRVVKAVKDAKDALLWRVQVRRGRIDFDGKDVPVTAIIGVEFKAGDVKEPE